MKVNPQRDVEESHVVKWSRSGDKDSIRRYVRLLDRKDEAGEVHDQSLS